MAPPAGRSQTRATGRQADPQSSSKLSFPAVLGGVTDTESPEPSSGAWKNSGTGKSKDAAATSTAAQIGTDEVDGRAQTRLTLSSLIALPATSDGTALRPAAQSLATALQVKLPAAGVPSAPTVADIPAFETESPPQAVALEPAPQRHSAHAKSARGSDKSTPLVESPAVTDATVPPQFQVAASDARTSVAAPRMPGKQAEPTADSAAADTRDMAPPASTIQNIRGELPGPMPAIVPPPGGNAATESTQSDDQGGPATEPSAPAATTRFADAPPVPTSEPAGQAAAETGSVSTLRSAVRLAGDASRFATGPEPSGAPASAGSDATVTENPARDAAYRQFGQQSDRQSDPQMETRLPDSAVGSSLPTAAPSSQGTRSTPWPAALPPALQSGWDRPEASPHRKARPRNPAMQDVWRATLRIDKMRRSFLVPPCNPRGRSRRNSALKRV